MHRAEPIREPGTAAPAASRRSRRPAPAIRANVRPISCVVSTCDRRVRWRRVLRFTSPSGGAEPDKDESDLIAEVSIYLCDRHRDAGHTLTGVEPFPPDQDGTG